MRNINVADATFLLHDCFAETARNANEIQRVSAMVESPRLSFNPGRAVTSGSLNGRSTVFPDHGAKEMGEGLRPSCTGS